MKYPYVFPYFGYDETSAGNVLIHRLCHDINKAGYEAYMITDDTNHNWICPKLKSPEALGRPVIVVTPENTDHLLWGGDYIVKYYQADFEKLGRGLPTLEGFDDLYAYADCLFPKNYKGEKKVLHFQPIDLQMFKEGDPQERKGSIYYANRVDGKTNMSMITPDMTEITGQFPATKEGLRDLYRKSEWCYVFAPTSVGNEAVMCGCPVIFGDMQMMSIADVEYGENGRIYGMALNDSEEEKEWAKSTIKKFQEKVWWHESQRESRVMEFIEQTQKGIREKLQGKR